MLIFSVVVIIVPLEESPVSAAWWNASWTYMKVIQITNPSVSYQMKIIVNKTSGNINCSGHCNNNFSDIRFTTSTNTSVDFWLQNYTSGVKGYFWVETDGGSSINMYYGNAGATTTSNGTKTFMVWDGFEYAGNISAYGWEWMHGPTLPNTYVAQSGSRSIRIQHQKPSTYFHRHFTNASVFQYWFYDNKTFNGVGQELNSVANTRWDVDVGHNKLTSSTLYTKCKAAVTTTIANVTKLGGAWHSVEWRYDGTRITLKLDNVMIFNNLTDSMDELFFYCNEFGVGNTSTMYDWYVDSVLIRKYSLVIPVLGTVSSEYTFSASPFPIVVSGVYPAPGAVDVKPGTICSIHVTHLQGAKLNLTFSEWMTDEMDTRLIGQITNTYTAVYDSNLGVESNLTYTVSFIGVTIPAAHDIWKLNQKYYWMVNITDGLGNKRNYPNSSSDGDIQWGFMRYYNFTTGSVNNTDAITVNDLNFNTSVSHTEEYVNGTGWIVNYTSESQLNMSENLFEAAGTHEATWNTPFWDVWANYTGYSHNLNILYNILNATGLFDYHYHIATGWDMWVNYTRNTTPLTVYENLENTTGTHDSILNSTGYYVWANYTGDLTPLQKFENIIDAVGSHTLVQNSTGYYVWANYTGTASTIFAGENLTIINPNPGNGTHSENYLKNDVGGLTTSVDVTYINFTTPSALIPGTYSSSVASESRSNGACIWNGSVVYNDAWDNATGQPVTGPLYVGQYEMAGEYVITRSYLIFNTSSIPDEATITSAFVQLMVYDDHSATDFNVTIQQVKPPAPHSPLAPGDYNKGNFPPSATYGNKNVSGYVDDSWFNITVNASGILDISKTGYTNWVLRSDQDIIASAPAVGDDEWQAYYAPGGVNPAYGPHLIINYTIPSSNWQHIVNLTFYNYSSSIPYNTTWVQSNGTVTVPAPMFNGVDAYEWNVTAESNHTNWVNSTVWNFETVASSGLSSSGSGSNRYTSFFMVGLCFGLAGGMVLINKRRRKRKEGSQP